MAIKNKTKQNYNKKRKVDVWDILDSITQPSIWYVDITPKDVTVSFVKHIFIYADFNYLGYH